MEGPWVRSVLLESRPGREGRKICAELGVGGLCVEGADPLLGCSKAALGVPYPTASMGWIPWKCPVGKGNF